MCSPLEVVVVEVFTYPFDDPSAPGEHEVTTSLAQPETLHSLAEWMSRQRWYGAKGRIPKLRLIGEYSLEDPTEQAAIRVLLVRDEHTPSTLYQVPVTVRTRPCTELSSALATATFASPPLYFYDGPKDPVCAGALLQLILDGAIATASADDGAGSVVQAVGHTKIPGAAPRIRSSRVLGGEQSNTSIVYEMMNADGAPSGPIICKLFRTIHHGDNPDVVLLDALGAAGSLVVPQSIGHLSARWPDPEQPGGMARGHLAFAQEFLPGVDDAWRVTLRAAEDGKDFASAAHALGEATAEVHATLAQALGTNICSASDRDSTLISMRQRLAIAIDEVPELATWRDEIEALYARAAASPWPVQQRIHGDLHLGQVLAVPARGWVLLDFEGEPLRPMSERNCPDFPLRDIAGMLRSFDYVAGAVSLANPAANATGWAHVCREAFIDGYSARGGHDLRSNRLLLDVFEIDKALYEVVYEARNRPSWLPIPVAAITRLAERAAKA